MAASDIDRLVETVRRKDYGAQLLAPRAGSGAVAHLTKLLVDPDEEVRELAVYCLEAIGDAQAGDELVSVTLDIDPQVAMAAARALHRLGSPQLVPGLMAALSRSADPFVRRELALVLGRFAGAKESAQLRRQFEREQSPEVRHGILAALARMGDRDSREAFAMTLTRTVGVARKPWLDLAEYIHQAWLISPLAGVLHDQTPILLPTGHGMPIFTQALRACDLAVLLIAEISETTFSFTVVRAKNYSVSEVDEVRRFANSIS